MLTGRSQVDRSVFLWMVTKKCLKVNKLETNTYKRNKNLTNFLRNTVEFLWIIAEEIELDTKFYDLLPI